MEVLWTERFHRLRAVRKAPSDRTWKAIQMAARATTMPSRRVSISVEVSGHATTPPVCGVAVVARST